MSLGLNNRVLEAIYEINLQCAQRFKKRGHLKLWTDDGRTKDDDRQRSLSILQAFLVPRLYLSACSSQLKFFLLINVKMLTIFGIETFICRKNSILGLSEPEQKIPLNFLIFLYLRAFKISCSAKLSTKKFYNPGA